MFIHFWSDFLKLSFEIILLELYIILKVCDLGLGLSLFTFILTGITSTIVISILFLDHE